MGHKNYCYFQGSVIEEAKATLSLANLGVVRGFGVFDFFRMRDGRFSFLDQHLNRFDRSQKFLGLSEVIKQDEIRDALDTLKGYNSFSEGGFKLVLLADGNETDQKLSPLFYILHTDLRKYQPPTFGSIITHEYIREYPLIKSTNYFTSQLLHRKRIMAGAIDVVYHLNDSVSEASRSNVFVIKDGKMRTPARNILEGVTRKELLKLSQDIIPTSVEDVSFNDLITADEVFLTSTLKEVCPIVEIDGKTIGSGKVGPYTRAIGKSFREMINDSLLIL